LEPPMHTDGTGATAQARLARVGRSISAVNGCAGLGPVGVHRCASVVPFSCVLACACRRQAGPRQGRRPGRSQARAGRSQCRREAMDEAWRRLLIGWRPAWYNFLGNKAISLRELLQDWPVKRTNRAETDKTTPRCSRSPGEVGTLTALTWENSDDQSGPRSVHDQADGRDDH